MYSQKFIKMSVESYSKNSLLIQHYFSFSYRIASILVGALVYKSTLTNWTEGII